MNPDHLYTLAAQVAACMVQPELLITLTLLTHTHTHSLRCPYTRPRPCVFVYWSTVPAVLFGATSGELSHSTHTLACASHSTHTLTFASHSTHPSRMPPTPHTPSHVPPTPHTPSQTDRGTFCSSECATSLSGVYTRCGYTGSYNDVERCNGQVIIIINYTSKIGFLGNSSFVCNPV